MNSVSRHLSAQTVAATLIAMRSARKEVLLIVEGSSDIYLYSNIFKLPRSNFISCGGKEKLEELYEMAPTRGLDRGTIFIRDRDCDGQGHLNNNDILLLKTDLYDIEMHLLATKLFHRMFDEYLAHRATAYNSDNEYRKVVGAAAHIGALRKHSHDEGLGLNFSGIDLKFIDYKTLDIDVPEMIRKVSARSGVNVGDINTLSAKLQSTVSTLQNQSEISRGKDVLGVMHIAFHRHYKCCSSSECEPEVLAKVIRIAANLDDLLGMSLIGELSRWLEQCPFEWGGASLPKAA